MDDVEFNFVASGTAVPALPDGTTVSWSGTSTFTLESGTYDTIFNPGTYNSPDGANAFVLTVEAVPEPSTYALFFGGILLSFGFWRRLKILSF